MIPFVGHIAEAVGCLFIDRGSSRARKDMLTQISDRQLQCEQGIFPPLILYPEGGTTNGTHLVKFKKGAFNGLRSIQPVIIQYYSPFVNIENSVYNFFAQSILCATCPYASVKIATLPVFTPNEYFFKNHQRVDEEKWETYARVIRDLMA